MKSALMTGRRNFLSVLDFDAADFERCLQLAAQLKAERSLGRDAPTAHALDVRHVALLFDKPSLRTWTTFEIAVRELGGNIVPLQADVALGKREPVADVARNLERWVDAVVIRTFSQRLLQEFACAAKRLHVVNALTDEEHPCQAIADFLRRQVFASYQVNEDLMALARPGALFMHCLPAHRGEEVTADVFESPASVVFDQAENRLHGQKALLLMLLAASGAL